MSEIFIEEIGLSSYEKSILQETIREIKESMKFWDIFPDKGKNQRITTKKIFETIFNQYLPSSLQPPTEIKYYFHSPNQIEIIGLYQNDDLEIGLQILTYPDNLKIFISSNSNLVYSLSKIGKS